MVKQANDCIIDVHDHNSIDNYNKQGLLNSVDKRFSSEAHYKGVLDKLKSIFWVQENSNHNKNKYKGYQDLNKERQKVLESFEKSKNEYEKYYQK